MKEERLSQRASFLQNLRSMLSTKKVGSATTTSPQPDLPSRSPYACLSVEIPETSHLSENDLEDLPPSYSALESSSPTLPPSYSTLEMNQDAPEFFKT